jgi:hypothetical protein
MLLIIYECRCMSDGIYFARPYSENSASWMGRRRKSNESQIIYLFVLYLMALSVTRILQRRMSAQLVASKLEKM